VSEIFGDLLRHWAAVPGVSNAEFQPELPSANHPIPITVGWLHFRYGSWSAEAMFSKFCDDEIHPISSAKLGAAGGTVVHRGGAVNIPAALSRSCLTRLVCN
jgi:hypothetical protein